MKVAVLTSSRADFGIYLPLLRKLKNDHFFNLEIVAFGTHLSDKFGKTIREIEDKGFSVNHKIDTIPENDTPAGISKSMAKTMELFAEFWNKNRYDIVFCLGDRFEMLAAVLSGSPFNVTFAHIHAGETTLGAIDNAYRHSISLNSKYLFVTTEQYKKRAVEIVKRPENVFVVGALSIDNLKTEKLYTVDEFYEKFGIDLSKPSILTTFHPETIGFEKNKEYIEELIKVLRVLSERYQIVITMPNADTTGLMIRQKLKLFGENNKNVKIVESFGMKGYLSCMKHSKFLLGNTSSAFVEASFFPKWVINLGNRQRGRIVTPNILTVPVSSREILEAVEKIEHSGEVPDNCNIYGNGDAADRILEIIKNLKK